jgi:hypothetical protein
LLNATDLAGATEVSRLTGWKQTIDDREMLVRLDPQVVSPWRSMIAS